jgi:DNA-binding transcriptional LysR family regulator
MDRLHLINVFVAVVDAGGLAGAARKLAISPPAVTRAVNELEAHLGVRLLTRTTRVVKVTEAGARYAEDCRRILAALADADASATGSHGEPRGRLVVTAPVLFGARFVMPVVTAYLTTYPDTTVTCWFVDRVVHFVDDDVDVAIRIGELPDSSLQAVRVGQVRRVVCGSPSYLDARGAPASIDELNAHTIISANSVSPLPDWHFRVDGQERAVSLRPRLVTSTNEAARAAALAGFGLTRLLSYQVADQLRDGALVAVLQAAEPEPLPVHVVHREGRHATAKVRAFLDRMIQALRVEPGLRAA